jgi:hypothetical protein
MPDRDVDADEPEMCHLGCGNEASMKGVLVVNARAYPNTPLCDKCFIPFDEISLPQDVDRETLAEQHTDRPIV